MTIEAATPRAGAADRVGGRSTESQSYPGGKSGAGVYQRLINEIPPHRVLVIPFAGRCGVARRIRPAEHTVVIDRDPEVLDWWQRWQRKPEGRAVELHHADGIEWLRFRFGLTQWPTPPITATQDPATTAADASQRGGVLGAFGEAFVFADPPYVLASRKSGRIYKHEMSDADHQRLLDVLRSLPVPVMLCGLASPLYSASLQDWRTFAHDVPTRAGLQTELVWMSYAEPSQLHDHRFIGRNRRDRERIRRRQRNVAAMLRRMTPRERAAMLEAIDAYQT